MSKRKLKLYFAHPQCTYNTILEEFALEHLHKTFNHLQIVNPNEPMHQKKYKEEGREYFKKLVSKCDYLCVLPFGDESLGARVAKEVQWMMDKGGSVWILTLFPISTMRSNIYRQNQWRVLSIKDTRKKLKSYKYGTYHKKG